MGDTGSLGLGGAVAGMAADDGHRAGPGPSSAGCRARGRLRGRSIISFKLFKRRVLLMAPLHHHFELKAWSETKIIVRFWIVAAIFAGAGFAAYYATF